MFSVYLPEDTWISVSAFLCLSVYAHSVAGMLVSWVLERAMDRFFPRNKNPLLTSRTLHTWLSVFVAVLLTTAGVAATRRQPVVRSTFGEPLEFMRCCFQLRLVEVAVPSLPADLHGFSIAVLTDVHIGPTVSRERIENVVHIVNSLNADAVTIVGEWVLCALCIEA